MNKSEEIMQRIGKILKDTNAGTFTITGYKHLETKLVLHFYDCQQVFIFKDFPNQPLEVTKFFTKNYLNDRVEYFADIKAFKDLHEKVKPE